MQNKKFKKFKINQLQNIQQNYKYIYVFRYNDLKINEIITIKKKLKNLNYNIQILKQNITNKFFFEIKGQGSVLIIYGNEYTNLLNTMQAFKKTELIYLIVEKNIYSHLKLKSIINNSNNYINVTLIQPFLNFLYYLRKTQKANIT